MTKTIEEVQNAITQAEENIKAELKSIIALANWSKFSVGLDILEAKSAGVRSRDTRYIISVTIKAQLSGLDND